MTEAPKDYQFDVTWNARQFTCAYVNYRGEKSLRVIEPQSVRFGVSEYHTEPQWLMTGFDILKEEYREFAMKDITKVQPRNYLIPPEESPENAQNS